MSFRQVCLVGLGRMGLGVGHRLSQIVTVRGFDPSAEARSTAKARGITACESIEDMVSGVEGKKVVWIMVPAGETVDRVLEDKALKLNRGDIVIEGGNSFFKDSLRRAQSLAAFGVSYLDVGTSGGVWGEKNGFCLMVGGEKGTFAEVTELLKSVAGPEALLHVGPCGSGHYVKMVHNAIEYGMLQVLGEGFWLLKSADSPLDLERIANLWNHGSVVRSWLLELTQRALGDGDFEKIADEIGGGQTGHWAVQEALDRKVPVPLISTALMERFVSRHDENFSHKLIAALRQQFGGHEVKKR